MRLVVGFSWFFVLLRWLIWKCSKAFRRLFMGVFIGYQTKVSTRPATGRLVGYEALSSFAIKYKVWSKSSCRDWSSVISLLYSFQPCLTLACRHYIHLFIHQSSLEAYRQTDKGPGALACFIQNPKWSVLITCLVEGAIQGVTNSGNVKSASG